MRIASGGAGELQLASAIERTIIAPIERIGTGATVCSLREIISDTDLAQPVQIVAKKYPGDKSIA